MLLYIINENYETLINEMKKEIIDIKIYKI